MQKNWILRNASDIGNGYGNIHFSTYIIDPDVRGDIRNPLAHETDRQKSAVGYEWHRLAQYRKQGDL